MGVELQHAVVYGYIVDVQKRFHIDDNDMDEEDDPYLGFKDKDAERGDFVSLTPNYGSSEVLVMGRLEFITDSVRWEGPQSLPLRELEEPDVAVRMAIDEIVNDLPVKRKSEHPRFITLTYKW